MRGVSPWPVQVNVVRQRGGQEYVQTAPPVIASGICLEI